MVCTLNLLRSLISSDYNLKLKLNKMECDICFESYNRSEKLPKVLKHCGHTFCESCVGHMFKGRSISCPACRQEQPVNENDYPVNNYALLVAIEEIADER